MSRAKKVRRGFIFDDEIQRRVGVQKSGMYKDRFGTALHLGDIVRVRVRGNPRRVIKQFYTDISNGLRLDRPVKHGTSEFVSWNGEDVVHVSSPQRLAEALTR